jgi:hypothetical protein
MMTTRARMVVLAGCVLAGLVAIERHPAAVAPLGIFEDQQDVGVPATLGPGSATYDAATKTYTIAGGGENMWASADHFHYVWKKMSGDVALSATIRFVATQPAGTEPVEHRKACLVLRQTLDADSAYVDAATHGNGMTALQWRETKGEVSHDIETDVVGPARLKIEKRGDEVMMFVANPGEPWKPAGGSTRIHLTGEFYVGLGVSSHSTSRIDTATFSDVEIGTPAPPGAQPRVVSTLETISLASMDRRVSQVLVDAQPMRSAMWSPEGTNLVSFARGGTAYRLLVDLPRAALNPSGPRTPERLDAAEAARIRASAPPAGDEGERSPDGAYRYFGSDRGGSMQIWRSRADGSGAEALTSGDLASWSPHVSPDGKSLVFLSSANGAGRSTNGDLVLRRMTLADRTIDELTKLWGGPGTLASGAFAPTSQYLAFVSYQRVAR